MYNTTTIKCRKWELGAASLGLWALHKTLLLPYTVSIKQMESQKYIAHFKQIKNTTEWTHLMHCQKALLCLSRYISDV